LGGGERARTIGVGKKKKSHAHERKERTRQDLATGGKKNKLHQLKGGNLARAAGEKVIRGPKPSNKRTALWGKKISVEEGKSPRFTFDRAGGGSKRRQNENAA